jgi:hypothetical protein
VFDKSVRRDGTFGRDDFSYDIERDLYTCPTGEELRRYWHEGRRKGAAASRWPLKIPHSHGRMRRLRPAAAVLPNGPHRKILRSVHEGARDLARDIATTDAYVTSRRQRKKVEMLFAHLKRILKLDRLRLRGPNGAKDEFLLAATAQNLRKMAKLVPMPAQMAPA